MKMMNAILFKDTGKFSYERVPIPGVRRPDDVLVRVEVVSICGTDVHILGDPPGVIGTPGIVLGHECVGTVIEAGKSVTAFRPGDRVVLEPNLPCGYCRYCREGVPNLCANDRILGTQVDGVFAEYFVAPQRGLGKVPDGMPAELAVFAEPVNCVMGAMNKIRLLPGQTATVLGGGPAGLYFTMLLKKNGASQVFVSEPSKVRAKYARECGADLVIDPESRDVAQVVRGLTGGMGTDVTLDAVGILADMAIRCTKRAGHIVLYGLNAAREQTICQNDIARNGLNLHGSYIGLFTLQRTIDMLAQDDHIPVEKIVTHRLPMSRFQEGLEAMKDGTGLEVLLYPEQ